MEKYDFVDKYFEEIEGLVANPSRENVIATLHLIYMIGERDGFVEGQRLIMNQLKGNKAA